MADDILSFLNNFKSAQGQAPTGSSFFQGAASTSVNQVQQILSSGPLSGLSSPIAGVPGGASSLIGQITGQGNNRGTQDVRVRLKAQPAAQSKVYGPQGSDNLLGILYETDGMVFPYTPTIQVGQDVDYKSVDLVHANMDVLAYTRTPPTSITITGKFTVQNQREGRYAVAALHFLRTVSKMYFGEADKASGLAGLPPPVLMLSGYGNYMFNDLKVVVKNHSYTLDDTVSFVNVAMSGGVARVPSLFSISVMLTVQQTPNALRTKFSLDKFRTGELMRGGNTGWI